MRRMLVIACLMAAAPSVGNARADEARAEFSGFYVGLNTGYGFGASGDWCFCTFLPNVTDAAGGEGGVLAGAETGYGLRWGPVVLEAAARMSHADLKFSESCLAGLTCTGELAWLGEAQISAGVVVGNLLFAGTIGYGVADVHAQVSTTPVDTALHDGRVFAARVESGMSGSWRMGVEYRHFDMDGTHDVSDAEIAWTAHALSLVIRYELE